MSDLDKFAEEAANYANKKSDEFKIDPIQAQANLDAADALNAANALSSIPDNMKQDTQALMNLLGKSVDTGKYKMRLEVRGGKFPKISIVSRNVVPYTEPQIEMTIYEPGKVRAKLHPYGLETDGTKKYEKYYFYAETTTETLKNEMNHMVDFLKTDDCHSKNFEKVSLNNKNDYKDDYKKLVKEKMGKNITDKERNNA